MHVVDDCAHVSAMAAAHAAAQGQGSGARHPIAVRIEAGASTAARANLADAFGLAWAGRCIIFRGNGSVEAV